MYRYQMLLLGLVIGFMLTANLRAEGVDDIRMSRSRFFVDYASFAAAADNRLEIYYKIFNDGLNYVKVGDKFVASYEINVIILGEKDRQITGQSVDKTYILDDYALTRSREGFLVNQVEMKLEPGKYVLICKVIDHNSNDVSTIESKFESPRFDRRGDIADIEFIQKATAVGEKSKFAKDGLMVVPLVERSFDAQQQDLGFYVEMYLADYLNRKLTLAYEIVGQRSNARFAGKATVASAQEVARLKLFESLAHLPPGDYDLTLSLKQQGRVIARRKTGFSLKWSLASLIKNDFEHAVEQLKYIISKRERRELLEVSDSMRLEKFEEWWASKDPTEGTPENELRDEYYRRIRYANQYYRSINREGWQTDRGMIYIKYGEPDQIDRHPFELGRKPFQIWYYYAQRRTFVFEDNHGDGDYQLQYPYDGDWRRYIGP